jgi:manganese transport protein
MESELNIIKRTSLQHIGIFSRLRHLLKFLGPAFIVSVAYIDPGNFAANITGGSTFNYSLLWVILCSNLMAIFLQSLSAKLGIVTKHNLPEMCSIIFSKKINWFLWFFAELSAIATNLAEFLGGTLGLYLLFNIPMIYAGIITGLLTYIIAYMEKYGQRVVEAIIAVFIGVISIAYIIELFLAKPDWNAVKIHTFVPALPNGQAVLIAVSMLGATVMPHVIYLHSQLVQNRCTIRDTAESKLKHLKMERIDIAVAMNIAFIVNASMVIVSAAVFYKNGMVVTTIEQAHKSLEPLVGSLSSYVFGIALLASGLSSSVVGTLAGQTIMNGFVNLKFSANVSRLITMAPAMLIICIGINPMKALVISQVLLSFTLPLAIVPMIIITGRKDIMGALVNKPIIKIIGWIITSLIVGLNAVLLYLTFMGNV